MILLRRVIGDALRARRQGQHRTLREVSTAANVSLGYLSEIERGQKEASSELLAAICDALGARLSELLREVSDTLTLAEQVPGVLLPVREELATSEATATAGAARSGRAETTPRASAEAAVRSVATGGSVSIAVRPASPLKATLRTARRLETTADRERGVVCAA